jgi:hypothetical protein
MTLSIDEVAQRIYDDICGTPNDVFAHIDYLIEDGVLTKEWYKQNETNLLYAVDNQMFNCGICGWNVEVSEMSWGSSNMGETVCCDCGDDDES